MNNTVNGVFIDIIGDETKISSFEMFLKDMNPKSKTLTSYLAHYKKEVTQMKDEFDKLGHLEEIIMQLRAKERISDIKLSLVREYIYARAPFYRKGKTAKDIRIIVDNVKNWSPDMVSLINNQEFMSKAEQKLIDAMDNEIKSNLSSYETKYTK